MNPNIQTRHRVARVGNLLAKGPFSIRPPRAVDDYGWLECYFRLTHVAGGVVESAAVYLDDSMNRDSGFLPPVLRHVRWERGEDLRRAMAGELAWPTAVVNLSHFEEDRPRVDALIRSAQARLRALPVIEFGLCAERQMPAVDADPRGTVTVFTRTGAQSVEYTTWSAGEAELFQLVLNGLELLRELRRPLDLTGWRESYPFELTSTALGVSKWWDYRPPSAEPPAA